LEAAAAQEEATGTSSFWLDEETAAEETLPAVETNSTDTPEVESSEVTEPVAVEEVVTEVPAESEL
jgi:hypothetical protein